MTALRALGVPSATLDGTTCYEVGAGGYAFNDKKPVARWRQVVIGTSAFCYSSPAKARRVLDCCPFR